MRENDYMTSATCLAFSLALGAGALTMLSADQKWFKSHAWLIPYFEYATGLFALACAYLKILSADKKRTALVAQ